MDHYSILNQSSAAAAAKAPVPGPAVVTPMPPPPLEPSEAVRFPGEDGGRSLADTASSDFDAALYLLAERAKYITGAQAATISLLEDGELICRACVSAAQKTGMPTKVGSGLAAECARTRRILRCNDTANDPRVNAEICGKYGIASALVMPLIRGQEVVGVFELLSGNIDGFEERDLTAMQRLGEMIETALDHANAAQQVAAGPAEFEDAEAEPNVIELAPSAPEPELQEEAVQADEPATRPAVSVPAVSGTSEEGPFLERGSVGTCQACGFPVSGQRSLCVDCERAKPGSTASQITSTPPAFLADLQEGEVRQGSWLRRNGYAIAALLLAGASIGLLIWLRMQ